MSINKAILVGNVGKDPEVRYLEGGTAVCSFPLATSENYRNRDGERVESTEWHNIVLWRGLAEVAEKYVRKGAQLYIEGRIRSRSWEDRDGNKRYTTEIIGDTMQMLGRRSDESRQQGDRPAPKENNREKSAPDGQDSPGSNQSAPGDSSQGSSQSAPGDSNQGSSQSAPGESKQGSSGNASKAGGSQGNDDGFSDIDSDAINDDLPF